MTQSVLYQYESEYSMFAAKSPLARIRAMLRYWRADEKLVDVSFRSVLGYYLPVIFPSFRRAKETLKQLKPKFKRKGK